MTQSTEERIYRVVSEVFGVPREEINADSSPDTIPSWDSLSHISLILSLEAEFGVSLSPEDAMEMLSVRLVQIILADHGVVNSE